MASEIIVLSWLSEQVDVLRFIKLANLMGISTRLIIVDSESSVLNRLAEFNLEESLCVAASSDILSKILFANRFNEHFKITFFRMIAFLFVFGFSGKSSEGPLLRCLTDGALTHTEQTKFNARYEVSKDSRRFCQQLAGLSFGPVNPENDLTFVTRNHDNNIARYILIQDRPFLVEIQRNKCRIILVGSREIIDVDEPVAQVEGIKPSFSRIVPAILFIRNVFGEKCWHNKRHYASLIIDDPLLKERYGFLNYRELLKTMDQHDFATTIAFIPWNYRRTQRAVAQLFRERRDRFSICVHGCDHKEAEFGSTDHGELVGLIKTANQRMNFHEKATGIRFEKIMVFPQGVFSTKAMVLLKNDGYLAAINSTPFAVNEDASKLIIRDFFEIPVLAYGSFPLFVRRYPKDLAEFALDLLLGKPLLIVEHHGYFKTGLGKLIYFVKQVKRLEPNIRWGPLGTILNNTYLEREDEKGIRHVKFYTPTLQISNESNSKRQYLLYKREPRGATIAKVKINGESLPFLFEDDVLCIQVDVRARSTAMLEVEYKESLPDIPLKTSYSDYIKVFFRRYLSELRDNHLSKNDFLFDISQKLKKLLF